MKAERSAVIVHLEFDRRQGGRFQIAHLRLKYLRKSATSCFFSKSFQHAVVNESVPPRGSGWVDLNT